ncbi:MAG: radical SAM protein [Bacteroidota bacterium]
MPHSACNCRCIMCDIWQDNKNLKQLSESDLDGLLSSLKKYKTQIVVMSGGEALLNKNFFKLCEILRNEGIRITLLSTGLSIKQHADEIIKHISEVIVSLDGSETIHDQIRRIPNAFKKLEEGVRHLKSLHPALRVTARTVIQSQNFKDWPAIIESAKKIGLNQVSFLPADVSSQAFNREVQWGEERKEQVQPALEELPELKEIIEKLIKDYQAEFSSGFIAESPEKIRNIYRHYAASYQLMDFPFKKCNAPWVSTVIEADGTVRHCFFLESVGNIRKTDLDDILNGPEAIAFRKNLNTASNSICAKCVCSLNLSPLTNF